MKRVTIICESLVQERIKRLLKEVGAHGFTLFDVQGSGSQGERAADIGELANVQIDVIVPEALAGTLMEKLHRDLCWHVLDTTNKLDAKKRTKKKVRNWIIFRDRESGFQQHF